LTLREKLATLQPRNPELQKELGYSFEILASLYTLTGPPEKVIEYADQAIPILEKAVGSARRRGD